MPPFNIPDPSDWIFQYYEDLARGITTEAEHDAMAAAFNEAFPDYFDPAYRAENPLGTLTAEAWYAELGLANYGISLEEYIETQGGWYEYLDQARQESGQPSIQVTDELLAEYFGDDWEFWRDIMSHDPGTGFGAPLPDIDLSRLGVTTSYDVELDEEVYFYNGGLIGETYDEAVDWLMSQGVLVEPGYEPPTFPEYVAPGEPPPPFMPEWAFAEELTGIAPGERISPGRVRLPSGQAMSRMTPSEMAGLGGLVEWSAGRAPGAWAGAQDFWAEAMGMLPTSVPRGTVRWSPSPFRA